MKIEGKLVSKYLVSAGNVQLRESMRDCDVEVTRYKETYSETYDNDGVTEKYWRFLYYKRVGEDLVKTGEEIFKRQQLDS